MVKNNRRGLVLVISSPSGAGKTTICKNIIEKVDNVSYQFPLLQERNEKVRLKEKIIFLKLMKSLFDDE